MVPELYRTPLPRRYQPTSFSYDASLEDIVRFVTYCSKNMTCLIDTEGSPQHSTKAG